MINEVTIGELKSLTTNPKEVYNNGELRIISANTGRQFSFLKKDQNVHVGTRSGNKGEFAYLNFWYTISDDWTDEELIKAIVPRLITRYVKLRMTTSLGINPEEHSLERAHDHVLESGLLDFNIEFQLVEGGWLVEIIGDEGETVYRSEYKEVLGIEPSAYFPIDDTPNTALFYKAVKIALISKALMTSKFDHKAVTIFQ